MRIEQNFHLPIEFVVCMCEFDQFRWLDFEFRRRIYSKFVYLLVFEIQSSVFVYECVYVHPSTTLCKLLYNIENSNCWFHSKGKCLYRINCSWTYANAKVVHFCLWYGFNAIKPTFSQDTIIISEFIYVINIFYIYVYFVRCDF